MKKIILFSLGLVLSSALFFSCEKDNDFLKEDPKTIYTVDNAFEKSTQVDAALVRAYNKFNEMNAFSNAFMGGEPSSNFLHGEGADVLGGTWGDPSGLPNFWALRSDESSYLNAWNSLYQLASYANMALKGIGMIDPSGVDVAYLEAQARFFRGWSYLRLAEMFGRVPIQETFSEEAAKDYEQSTREQVYSFAVEDLKAAAAGLPEYPAQSGRAAKGIARHFLAEAYLGRGIETGNGGDYTEAVNTATAVIQAHPLMTARFGARAAADPSDPMAYKADGNVFFDLFVKGNYAYGANGNTESLMIYVQPEYEQQSVYGGQMLFNQITCGPAYRDIVYNQQYMEASLTAGGGPGPWRGDPAADFDQVRFPGAMLGPYLTSSWGLIGALDYSDEVVWEGEFADDMRNDQVNRWDPVVMNIHDPNYLQPVQKEWLEQPARLSRVSGKITTPDLWGWDLAHCGFLGAGVFFCYMYGRDWYIARSAETYLLRAEAYLRSGDKEKAADDLNAVRRRAEATKLYTAAEVDEFAILDERARELAWEEMRWPTLLRMGGQDKNDVMHKQLEKNSMGTRDTDAFRGQQFPEWTLLPIPNSVMNLNTDKPFTQNKGWD